MKFFHAFILSLVISLAGCATAIVEPISTKTYPAKANSQDVQILYAPPTQTYEALAKITAYADYFDPETVLDRALKEQAAKIGADAVIKKHRLERYEGTVSTGSRSTGLAIKFKPVVADRQ